MATAKKKNKETPLKKPTKLSTDPVTPKVTKARKTPAKRVVEPKPVEVAEAPVVSKPRKKTNYLNNKDLLAQVVLSKQQDRMTDELAKMLQMLCKRYATRAQFANYTYNEDMQATAMMSLTKTWRGFNPEKSSNPFAYFTQCIKNSFIQILKIEKNHRKVRDELLIYGGLNPSYSYQLDYASEQGYNDNDDSQFTPQRGFSDSDDTLDSIETDDSESFD